ncbi:hypothetical protein TSOC_013236 [Tetrabaena socialis]|uniref:Protein kinase domain-containing protein n=1 Tax=Tetrabaena socialis TaxID=47790 RepID=A0A2J7ZKX4_9CHLO|nr:hypothetical protein TSOC_013236 [Tetrabaena socialis]|eukprot:PNH00912.1 hypothetical protein TSOC_013236 [Tetrabaena socialis]
MKQTVTPAVAEYRRLMRAPRPESPIPKRTRTLRDYFRSSLVGPIDRTLIMGVLFDQVVYALGALHDAGDYHGDLTPENIIVTRNYKTVGKDGPLAVPPVIWCPRQVQYPPPQYYHVFHVELKTQNPKKIRYENEVPSYYVPPELVKYSAFTAAKAHDFRMADAYALGVILRECMYGEEGTIVKEDKDRNGGYVTSDKLPALPRTKNGVVRSAMPQDVAERAFKAMAMLLKPKVHERATIQFVRAQFERVE